MTELHSNETWLIALVIAIGVIGGFGFFARWCSFSPAVRRDRLEKLRVGMTSSEIVALLGPPRESRTSSEGRRQWIYGAGMKRHILIIEFTANEAVESFAHGVPGRHAAQKDGL